MATPGQRTAITIVTRDGTVDRQNRASRQLLGDRGGERCCDVLSCLPVGDNVICSLTPGGKAHPAAWQAITERELSVLELLAAGETTGSAAKLLGLRLSTVRTHVEKLRLKLGASTQAAVVARGYQLGYLS